MSESSSPIYHGDPRLDDAVDLLTADQLADLSDSPRAWLSEDMVKRLRAYADWRRGSADLDEWRLFWSNVVAEATVIVCAMSLLEPTLDDRGTCTVCGVASAHHDRVWFPVRTVVDGGDS